MTDLVLEFDGVDASNKTMNKLIHLYNHYLLSQVVRKDCQVKINEEPRLTGTFPSLSVHIGGPL
jgi:hypothetical protein